LFGFRFFFAVQFGCGNKFSWKYPLVQVDENDALSIGLPGLFRGNPKLAMGIHFLKVDPSRLINYQLNTKRENCLSGKYLYPLNPFSFQMFHDLRFFGHTVVFILTAVGS
jgi:hypothetical protein